MLSRVQKHMASGWHYIVCYKDETGEKHKAVFEIN
jgi:hypothetical protein